MNTYNLSSGRYYRFSELPSDRLSVSSGEGDVFISLNHNDMSVQRIFVCTLSKEDVLCKTDAVIISGITYELAIVPAGDMTLSASICDGKNSVFESFNVSSFETLINRIVIDRESQKSEEESEFTENINTMLSIESSLNSFRKLSGIKSEHSVLLYKEQELFSLYSKATLKELCRIYNYSFDESLAGEVSSKEEFLNQLNTYDIRFRKVLLKDDFFNKSFRPLLSFTKHGLPVVLTSSFGKVFYKDPKTGKKITVSQKNRDAVDTVAYSIYSSLPEDTSSIFKMLKFIFSGSNNILLLMIFMGIISASLGMITPLLTSYIIDNLIPYGKFSALLELSTFLFVIITAQSIIKIVPVFVMMLFSISQFEKFMAGMFDRLLKLSPNFIKQYTTGDLTNRIMGAVSVQNEMFSIITGQFLSSLFALSGIIMMFYYSMVLALAGIGMTLLFCLIMFVLSAVNYYPLKHHAKLEGEITGMLRQFFQGICKIRVAGAENRVTNRFLQRFYRQEKLEYIISRNGSIQSIFSSTYPVIVSLVFYVMIIYLQLHSEKGMSLGVFMAFMAAFQTFEGGITGIFSAIWKFLSIQPDIQRITPLLREKPEEQPNLKHIGRLNGNIDISDVSFSYENSDTKVLNNISMHISQGEFVAIVGPSGAGKSTLIKILLGFIKPSTGSVYYDNTDLNTISLRSVRSQIGSIMQKNNLFSGSILDNVRIGTECTENEARDALDLACMTEDLKSFPMDIHTIITDDSISGGQKQRILLARSLVGRPQIIIMDEATSALDNVTQSEVMENLKSLKVTRVVIAHRLSTIKDADQIYVIDKGKLIASGNFDELMGNCDVFRKMASLQQIHPNHM
ncbi:MAG: ATP-binding cassette domain-containing protein [Succinivibrio sp.]